MSTTSHRVSPVYGALVLFSENVYFSILAFSRTPQILAMCSHHITAPPLQPVDADCSAGLHSAPSLGTLRTLRMLSLPEGITSFSPQEE